MVVIALPNFDIANSMIHGRYLRWQVPQSPMTPTPEMSMGQSMAPIDPALIQQLQMMASSGQTVQLQQALNQLPPEVLNQLLATLQGGAV
jgi:hypothetical protein